MLAFVILASIQVNLEITHLQKLLITLRVLLRELRICIGGLCLL